MSRHVIRLALVVALASAGCQWHPDTSAPPGGGSSANEVSQAELEASGGRSLLDALTRTRMNFFQSRGVNTMYAASSDAWLVFRGGMVMGTIDVFEILRPEDVRYVRRISAVETYHKYGRQVSQGGFEIELARN